MNYYTIYREKDDTILASGTSKECRQQLNLASVSSFYCLVCRSRSGKNKKYTVVTEKGKEE